MARERLMPTLEKEILDNKIPRKKSTQGYVHFLKNQDTNVFIITGEEDVFKILKRNF